MVGNGHDVVCGIEVEPAVAGAEGGHPDVGGRGADGVRTAAEGAPEVALREAERARAGDEAVREVLANALFGFEDFAHGGGCGSGARGQR